MSIEAKSDTTVQVEILQIIASLESEIYECSAQAEAFERTIKRGCTQSQEASVRELIDLLDKRIKRGKRQIEALEGVLRMSRERDIKYPPLVRRQLVKWLSVEEVTNDVHENRIAA